MINKYLGNAFSVDKDIIDFDTEESPIEGITEVSYGSGLTTQCIETLQPYVNEKFEVS